MEIGEILRFLCKKGHAMAACPSKSGPKALFQDDFLAFLDDDSLVVTADLLAGEIIHRCIGVNSHINIADASR